MRSDFSFKPTITNDEIANLPVQSFKGEVFYIDTFEGFLGIKHELENQPLLGFDTETRPSFKKGKSYGVSLLQLSTNDKAFLFRINKIGIPDEIIKILSSPHVTKVGVAIHDDIASLRKIRPFEPAGFIDLQQYVIAYGIGDKGLKKLVANILGFKISKRQQTSNWDAEVLSEPQLEYAATDAWVCYEIYNKLVK